MIGRVQPAVEFASEEASPWGELKLISGNANRELAHEISKELGIPLTDGGITRFSDGEIDVKIHDSMRGHDVFVIQPTCHPVNENLMELFILLDALRRASAGRVTAVVPYYGYARKERKSQPREPISAKLIANFITLAGADRVLLLDLHTEAIEGFFDVPTDHLTARKLLADYLRGKRLHDTAVVAPDVGASKRARAIANLLDAPIVFIDKRRPAPGSSEAEVLNVVGEVEGMDCVVVDDMITTGGTVTSAVTALKEAGARRVFVAATHPVFTGTAVDRLRAAPVEEVVVTNSIPIPPAKQGPPITVLNVAPLLAEAIIRVHENRSVSELFR
jgi:ribose-phosphate pyrophosphokinase